MAIGPKVRFEVFKRDGFACQYCGRKTPAVILEVDHVVPLCEGGADLIENLVTSCWECNRGKSGTPLGQLPESVDIHERTVALAEREMQLREYNELLGRKWTRENKEIEWLLDVWRRNFDWIDPENWNIGAVSLRNQLQSLSYLELAEAIEVTARASFRNLEGQGAKEHVSYFWGVVRRMKEQRA